jgi:serine/threonine-protein kinase
MSEQRTLRDFVLAGRWRFERVIGAGSDGTVYLALDVHTTERVAIKVYDSLVDVDPAIVTHRIESEANLVQQADSPWLVKFIQLGVTRARGGKRAAYAVLEYLVGIPLQNWMAAATPASLASFQIFGRILYCVDALHSAGWVHLDIKPENLFVMARLHTHATGSVKLFDFVNARMVSQAFTVGARGTPLYASPELCSRSGDVGMPADVYSLGILLYELMAGRSPIPTDSIEQIVSTHVYGHLDPMPRHLPEWARAFYRKSTARHPADRFPDAGTMMREWTDSMLLYGIHRQEL